jgi:hypothetical protein
MFLGRMPLKKKHDDTTRKNLPEQMERKRLGIYFSVDYD